MRRILLAAAFVAIVSVTHAQEEAKVTTFPKGFHFAGGVNGAFPVGDFSDIESAGVGVEVIPEYRFSKRLAVVFATGYTSFFGKDNYDDIGFIPVIAGLRGYIFPHFFIGSKWGVGILTGNGNSQTWFNAQPGLGYDARKLQVTLGLNLQRDHGESLTHISTSLLYKFK